MIENIVYTWFIYGLGQIHLKWSPGQNYLEFKDDF